MRIQSVLAMIFVLLGLSGCAEDASGYPIPTQGIHVDEVPEGRYHPIQKMRVDDADVMHLLYVGDTDDTRGDWVEDAIDTKKLKFFEDEYGSTHRFNVNHQLNYDNDLYVLAIQHEEGQWYKVLIRDGSTDVVTTTSDQYFVYTYYLGIEDSTHVANIHANHSIPEVFYMEFMTNDAYFQGQ